jgi:monofunctional biosynthetic peptidoglycan transglycosylase
MALVLLVAWLSLTNAIVLLLRWLDPPASLYMLQQEGSIWSLEHDWRPRDAISPHVAWAVIAAEDQKFIEHRGFDVDSIRRAVVDYRSGDGLRGASTISQQTAKNLFLWPGRSFARKALEAYFTVLLELYWPKERILEIYLNVAEFGDRVFGVEAAAQHFFGTYAADLSRSQAALLAAVLPSPVRYDAGAPSEYVRARQRWIINQMRRFESAGSYGSLRWSGAAAGRSARQVLDDIDRARVAHGVVAGVAVHSGGIAVRASRAGD